MKKVFLVVFISFCSFISLAHANNFYKGEVVKIVEEGEEDIFGTVKKYQALEIKIISGERENEIVSIKKGDYAFITEKQKLKIGNKVVLSENELGFHITDQYRLNSLLGIVIIFALFVLFLGRKKGLKSLLALTFSLGVIVYFIIPQILNGQNPLFINLVGGSLISVVSIYLSHGLNKRTTIAVLSTVISFICAIIISFLFVSWAKLFGVSSEEVIYLYVGMGQIDLQGLLLGGILIGILGILDDVTMTQCATVDVLSQTNKRISFKKLYQKGFSIGREHMISMVNTLALAYIGVSLPLFLLITLNKNQPLWTIINSEFVAVEIVRTLAGGCALILAVPISTFLSTYFYIRKNKKA